MCHDHKEPAGAGTSLLEYYLVHSKGLNWVSKQRTWKSKQDINIKVLLKFKIYHPYVCKPEVTCLTFEGAMQHMQMINHSYEYLREYFNTLNEVEHEDKRERGDNWTNLPYHQHANGLIQSNGSSTASSIPRHMQPSSNWYLPCLIVLCCIL